MLLFKSKLNKDDKDNKANRKNSSLQNPKILEVNLVKDEALISFDWNKGLFLILAVLLLSAALVAEIYYGLDWWAAQEMTKAQALGAQSVQTTAAAVQLQNNLDAALAYKAKSTDFSALLASHIYWTDFFTWLEKNTLSSVKYSSFTGDLSGKYTLEATAPTFADVSWQVKAFLNDPMTESAEVLSATAEKNSDRSKPSQVSFTLMLQVNPNIFKK